VSIYFNSANEIISPETFANTLNLFPGSSFGEGEEEARPCGYSKKCELAVYSTSKIPGCF